MYEYFLLSISFYIYDNKEGEITEWLSYSTLDSLSKAYIQSVSESNPTL